MPGVDRLIDVATAVADGTPLDWDDLRAHVEADDRSVLDALRAVSVVAGIHRSLPDAPDDLSLTAPSARPAGGIQSELGGFLITQRLGGGSQGEVYRAFDTRLERDVALKLRKRPPPGTDLAPILREGRLLAKLRHKHIVAVYGIEVVDEHVGISMELVDGETVDAVVRRGGRMPAASVATIALDLSEAIVAVHAAGLLHRDIKAQNVILEHGGRVVLMDFGTGAWQHDVEQQGHGGTPLYLAPELVHGGQASVASDIYALGTLLYFLLTSRFPFQARTLDELRQQLEAPAPRVRSVCPDVPADLAAIVDRCLEQDPAARFASARALGDALQTLVHGVVAPHAGASTRPTGIPPIRVLRFGIPALILAALAGGLAMRSPAAPVGIPVVAVQPFRDLSGTEQASRVADGLAESLAHELGRIKSLRVVATGSVRDADKTGRLSELVQQAGVTTLIGGTIDLTGSKARVNVRAVDAVSQSQLWDTWLERDHQDLLNLQDDVVSEIATRLKVELTEAHRNLVNRREPISAEAVDAYFRGWAESYRLTRSGHVEAERQFRRALQLAPNFAPARSGLAYTVFILGSSYRVFPSQQAYGEALEEASLARSLDPTWAHAHSVMGLLAFTVEWEWAKAEQHFLDAIDANPSDANVRGLYAQLLMLQNRLGAALAEARVAQRLDPLNGNRRSAISVALFYARRYEEAIAELEALQRADPNSSVAHFGLARYYSAVGRFDEALRQLETAPYKNEPPPKAEYVRILAMAGHTDEARERLPQLVEFYEKGTLAPDYLAYVYLALGDEARSLNLLDEAVQVRSPSVVWAQVDPRFDALRLHPEFRSLMNRLGFAQ